MTSLLMKLGADWHNPHPYIQLIQSVLPDSTFEEACTIENKLLQVHEDEHFDFKSLKQNKPIETLYGAEIEIAITKKKHLEDEVKREEERFNKLIEKFKEQNPPESNSDQEKEEEEEEEEEDEEEIVVKHKGKGQQACRRTLKKEEERKKALVNNIKSSMASSQGRLMEMGEEIENLEKFIEYYGHYDNASKIYLQSFRQATRNYAETKDLQGLIQELAKIILYYEKMMRRYVPVDPCQGEEKGLCKTHLLPLCRTVYPNQGFKHVWKCAAHP